MTTAHNEATNEQVRLALAEASHRAVKSALWTCTDDEIWSSTRIETCGTLEHASEPFRRLFRTRFYRTLDRVRPPESKGTP